MACASMVSKVCSLLHLVFPGLLVIAAGDLQDSSVWRSEGSRVDLASVASDKGAVSTNSQLHAMHQAMGLLAAAHS